MGDDFDRTSAEMNRIKAMTDGSREAVLRQMRREYRTNEALQRMPINMLELAIEAWIDSPQKAS